MPNNQVAVHTPRGCTQNSDNTVQTGTTTNVDCSTSSGCLVRENQANSYGKGFAAAGGGVFAILLDPSAIQIWFFSVCHTLPFFFLISHCLSDPTSPQSSNKQPHPLKWTFPPGVSQQHIIQILHVTSNNTSLLRN